jgi:hypothetical protein
LTPFTSTSPPCFLGIRQAKIFINVVFPDPKI